MDNEAREELRTRDGLGFLADFGLQSLNLHLQTDTSKRDIHSHSHDSCTKSHSFPKATAAKFHRLTTLIAPPTTRDRAPLLYLSRSDFCTFSNGTLHLRFCRSRKQQLRLIPSE
jgi:hypothetical protein